MIDLSSQEILKFALDSGMIDVDTIQRQIEMKKRKEYLDMHQSKIWQGSNGFWYTYLPTENKGRKLIKKNTLKEVEEIIVEFYGKSITDSFKNRFDIWVERQKLCMRSENTIYKYQSDYKRFFAGYPIERKDVAKITDEDIVKHIRQLLTDKPVSYKALKALYGYINGVFKKCEIDRLIPMGTNPCAYVDIMIFKELCREPTVKTAEQRTIAKNEAAILVDKIRNPKNYNGNQIVYYAVELSLYTGMRVGEIVALRWSDIDFDKKTIRIHSAEVRNRISKTHEIKSTKNKKERLFPLTDKISTLLHEVKKYEFANGYIGEFVFQDGTGRIHGYKVSNAIRSKTSSDEFSSVKSIHTVRRTVNSSIRCSGVSAVVASALIGNTERVNEQHYTYDITDMEEKMRIISESNRAII